MGEIKIEIGFSLSPPQLKKPSTGLALNRCTMNLFLLCTCAHTHTHKTPFGLKVPAMCWALCKFRGPGARTGLDLWELYLVVEISFSPGENWSPKRSPGEVLQSWEC